ncbi:FCD domain-containing protein [Pseudodesulfovibrio sp. JC047]|uniref:GntR family transcriptional regulator n=1 Tax=Pseudodesulfovibrio sp. JC047 TaxID=2683199 RepID=UPI0013D89F62|nr:GntR family transcriptional regulator [Pseudodesulfovibrio sp. JC047]NDV18567.1 FCD domain-containing protein [Pseudodesulfovibrio sp. JC047]
MEENTRNSSNKPETKRKKENLSTKILKTLRGRILNWEYPPNKPLVEESLCREFGVSRSPVREALRMLAAAGFAERMENRTFVVKQIHPDEVREIYELRKALELYVVEQLCARQDIDEGLDRLQQEWEEFCEKCMGDPPPDHHQVARKDQSFHEGMAKILGNQAIWKTLHSFSERLLIFRTLDFQHSGRLETTCQQHLDIIEAIRQGDVTRARAYLLDNIEEGQDNANDSVQKALLQSYY